MASREGVDEVADDAGCLREEPGVPAAALADEGGVRAFLTDSTLGETSSLRLFPEASRWGTLETGVSLDSLTGRPLVGILEGVDAMSSYLCALSNNIARIRNLFELLEK